MDDFERLLQWLDSDPEQAVKRYEIIRQKLTRFFLCRGCGVDSEALADDVVKRITSQIKELTPSYEGDPQRYFYGVARNVFLEWIKEQEKKHDFDPPKPANTQEKEILHRCLDGCLANLPDVGRRIILDYYAGEKSDKIERRRKLAEGLGMGPNALRIRAHRIRTELRGCVERCLKEENNNSEIDSMSSH